MLNCNGKRTSVFSVIAPASNRGHEKLLVFSRFNIIFTNKFYLSGQNSVRWHHNFTWPRNVSTYRTELHETLRNNRLDSHFDQDISFFFCAKFCLLKNLKFLKFFVEMHRGFSLWILIAKTVWKIETQIFGNFLGAQKKVAGSFQPKSYFQLAETTHNVEILCRFPLWIFFGGATSDNSAQAIIAGFQ